MKKMKKKRADSILILQSKFCNETSSFYISVTVQFRFVLLGYRKKNKKRKTFKSSEYVSC